MIPQYTEPELGILMLCALPGEDQDQRNRLYRRLRRIIPRLRRTAASESDELGSKALTEMGLTPEEASLLLDALSQRDVLQMFLSNLAEQGIQVITAVSPEYPARLLVKLGDQAPPVLFCAGNMELFGAACISLVGSRELGSTGHRFASECGHQIARFGYTYCSGGATGADTVGFSAAEEAGGDALIFLPDSLKKAMDSSLYGSLLRSGRLLLVSPFGADAPFTPLHALSRNALIHAMGQKVFVAQSDSGHGGTWYGTADNLKHHYSPVFVCIEDPDDNGARDLIAAGGTPCSISDLENLPALSQRQCSLFDQP